MCQRCICCSNEQALSHRLNNDKSFIYKYIENLINQKHKDQHLINLLEGKNENSKNRIILEKRMQVIDAEIKDITKVHFQKMTSSKFNPD